MKESHGITHLFDSWHFLKSLKFKDKKLEPEAKREIFKLMTAESTMEFEAGFKRLTEMQEVLKIDSAILQNLMAKK